MYENNRPAASRRSGDEFLRRMMSGEIPGKSMPVMNRQPTQQQPEQTSNGCCANNGTGNPGMPSLAMVYAPEQEWRCLLSPHDALEQASMFRELVFPFEGSAACRMR